jgi:hypothetical protein
MYYVIIDNEQVTSVLNYEPELPEGIEKVEISDDDYQRITIEKTHYFDIPTRIILEYPQEIIDSENRKKSQDLINSENRQFLNSTDWKVLRHIREQNLGLTTSLTQEEYLDLERSRASAASLIVDYDKYTDIEE